MTPIQLDEHYWVSPQISTEDVAEAHKLGFTVIVCNRPNGEAADQTPAADIAQAANQAGIKFVELPMIGANYTSEQAKALSTILEGDDKVLGYCRTGNRSTLLYRAAKGQV